jgi:hypothetical protein
MRHNGSAADRIESRYTECCEDDSTTIKLRKLRRKKKRGKSRCRLVKMPTEDRIIGIVNKEVITEKTSNSSKPRQRKVAVFKLKPGGKNRVALRIPKGSRVLNVEPEGRNLFVELPERRKGRPVTRKFGIYPLRQWEESRAGTVFQVEMPGNAKVIAFNQGEVIARLPKKPSKDRLWRLLALPLTDRGRGYDSGEACIRCYRVELPEESRILAVSSRAWIVCEVKQKHLKDDDLEKWFLVGLTDKHTVPNAKLIGCIFVRNIGVGPVYLLPEEN